MSLTRRTASAARDAGSPARADPAFRESWVGKIRTTRRAAVPTRPTDANSCHGLGAIARGRLLRCGGPDFHGQFRRARFRIRCDGTRVGWRKTCGTKPASHLVVGKTEPAVVEFVATEFEFVRREIDGNDPSARLENARRFDDRGLRIVEVMKH